MSKYKSEHWLFSRLLDTDTSLTTKMCRGSKLLLCPPGSPSCGLAAASPPSFPIYREIHSGCFYTIAVMHFVFHTVCTSKQNSQGYILPNGPHNEEEIFWSGVNLVKDMGWPELE